MAAPRPNTARMAAPDRYLSDLGPPHPCGGVIHRIDDWVYLGGSDAAEPAVLQANGIARVVRLYAGPPDVQARGVQYFVYPALDVADFDIRPVATEAVHQIQAARAAGARVLVHCHAGISRSVTAVLLYLMLQYHIQLDEALEALRRIRPCVGPNAGFMACLRATDAKLQSRRAGAQAGALAPAAGGTRAGPPPRTKRTAPTG
jgi:protein-tyrosine phosphatase